MHLKGCYNAVFTDAGLNKTFHLKHITNNTTTKFLAKFLNVYRQLNLIKENN